MMSAWENEDGPRGAGNTTGGLTRSSESTREGLAMKATVLIHRIEGLGFTRASSEADASARYIAECPKPDAPWPLPSDMTIQLSVWPAPSAIRSPKMRSWYGSWDVVRLP